MQIVEKVGKSGEISIGSLNPDKIAQNRVRVLSRGGVLSDNLLH